MLADLNDFCCWWNSGFVTSALLKDELLAAFADDIMKSAEEKFAPQNPRKLGCSELGKPAVYCAARHLGLVKPRILTPQACAIFLTGDFMEALILSVMKSQGLCVTQEQAEVDFYGVPGHVDAVVNGDLVEIKTMSYTYMTSFLRCQDDERGYVTQLSVYDDILKTDNAYWLCYNKATSELIPISLDRDKETLERAKYIATSLLNIKSFTDIQEYFDIPAATNGKPPKNMEDVAHLFYTERRDGKGVKRLWK